MNRKWSFELWAIWLLTIYMAIASEGSDTPANPYLAALLVMAFAHYLKERND